MTDLPTVKRTANEVERDVLAYEAAVADALGDLPLETQSELLDGLHDHLVEIAAEGELLELIGPPDKYAAELRGDNDSARQTMEPSAPSSPVNEPPAQPRPIEPRVDVAWARIARVVGLVGIAFVGMALLFDLNGRARKSDIVIPALIAGAALAVGWWLAQRTVPAKWSKATTVALVAAAILTAARLGLNAGIDRTWQIAGSPQYGAPATTFPPPIGTAFPPPLTLPMPDVRGMGRDEALRELSRRGLAVTIEEVSVVRASGGIVIDQEPAHDTIVDAGSAVLIRIAVSAGAEPTLSPSTTFSPVSTQVAPTNVPTTVPTTAPAVASVTTTVAP